MHSKNQLGPTSFAKIHNTMLSAVSMHINLLQPYQFTVEFSVILLSSYGLKQVNYSIHNLSTGLSFQRQTDAED